MRWFACLLMLVCGLSAAAPTKLTDTQLARYHDLNAQLRCLICQNRSIAESDAPLAKDLRQIVARQIVADRSDAQIKQYLVDRYGEWILYDPPLTLATLILWLGPFVLLCIGLIIVAVVMARRRQSGARDLQPLDRERLARVLEGHEHDGSTVGKHGP